MSTRSLRPTGVALTKAPDLAPAGIVRAIFVTPRKSLNGDEKPVSSLIQETIGSELYNYPSVLTRYRRHRNTSASLLRPDHRSVAGGHDGEGSGISAEISQPHSMDPPSHSEPMPAKECCNDSQRKGIDVDEKEVSWVHLSLNPDVEGAAGSGPGNEVKRVSSPLSVTSPTREREPGGT